MISGNEDFEKVISNFKKPSSLEGNIRTGRGCDFSRNTLGARLRTALQPCKRHVQESSLRLGCVCEIELGNEKELRRISIPNSCNCFVVRIRCTNVNGCLTLNKSERFSASQYCFSNPNVSFVGCWTRFCEKVRVFESRSDVLGF